MPRDTSFSGRTGMGGSFSGGGSSRSSGGSRSGVSTGGGRMTKTQRDAVGPDTMPRVTSGQPSRSRVTARPASAPPPTVKKVRPAAKKPAAPVKKPSVAWKGPIVSPADIPRRNYNIAKNRILQSYYDAMDNTRRINESRGKGDLGVNPRPTKFRTR